MEVGTIDAGLKGDFNKNGVVVISIDNPEKAYQWVRERSYLSNCKNFRILVFMDNNSTDKVPLDQFLVV